MQYSLKLLVTAGNIVFMYTIKWKAFLSNVCSFSSFTRSEIQHAPFNCDGVSAAFIISEGKANVTRLLEVENISQH